MNKPTSVVSEPSLADEMNAIPYEPLLPAEIKLIIGSLSLGIILLVILAWLTHS